MAKASRKEPVIAVSSSQKAVRVDRRRLAELVRFVAGCEGVTLAAVDLAVVGEDEIAQFNRDYLRRAGATDVLSFDLSDENSTGVSAQLIVCGDVAAKQGPLHGQRPQRELTLYVVHGLLHLMGYEDSTVRGAARMHAREEEILDQFENRPRKSPARKPKPPGGE